MSNRVTKAIFPVAGFGTRFLPATKSVPKEILPLIDRPLIQYAIDEARAAGIREFIFVTSRGKSALEDYFDSAPELEANLAQGQKHDLIEELRRTDMESGSIAYIRQQERLGLGHAVWCARRLIGDRCALQGNLDPAVLLGTPAHIEAEATKVVNSFGKLSAGAGHIFNLGHGISQFTPIDHVTCLVEAVAKASRQQAA